MPIPILMPALSPTMTEGNVATWIKRIGDNIKPGDIIAEVETDKATMEVEAIDEGVLASILYKDGSEGVPVNSLIGVITLENENENDVNNFIDTFKSNNNKSEETALEVNENNDDVIKTNTKEKQESIDVEPPKSKSNIDDNEKIKISPLAKRIALHKNVDLSLINGSGPNGRIIKSDLDIYFKNQVTATAEIYEDSLESKNIKTEIKLSSIRKTIASRLQESKQTIPHFYLKTTINVDNLVISRDQINSFLSDNYEEVIKISYNDIFIKATAEALNKVPEMNATWNESSITNYKNVDISVAVATKDGLFTPVIKNANNKKLITISREMKDFVKKARENRLAPEDYTGGCFSISNLGMYDIDEFSAIINPPQSGILAIGGIQENLILIKDKVEKAKFISFTLSVDHRIADGAAASKLLKYLKFYLNNPIGMFI